MALLAPVGTLAGRYSLPVLLRHGRKDVEFDATLGYPGEGHCGGRLSHRSWLGAGAPVKEVRVRVILRSTMAPVAATLRQGAGGWEVALDTPQYGVAQGQAAVLYAAEDDQVLGGGWIRAT